jgi:beta-N-acetylhexosaminidase
MASPFAFAASVIASVPRLECARKSGHTEEKKAMARPFSKAASLPARPMPLSAFITGCAGLAMSADEAAFIRDLRPAGLILFARNCETHDQVRRLTDDFRNALSEQDVLVLIDQEGGRVQRLRPPNWRALPPASAFGALYALDRQRGLDAARLAARVMAQELAPLGITMNCAPVLDLPVPGAHGIIGDRAYGTAPDAVAELARAVAAGLLAGGVLPVIKHIPGHGRATADSHLELPVVKTSAQDLRANDFAPFRLLADLPAAMTAHVVYDAFDPKEPATTSLTLIQDIIRGEIGFSGLLMSDDLGMKALAGTMKQRTERALFAGCDLVLHCNGELPEMRDVAAAAGALEGAASLRLAGCLALLGANQPFDLAEAEAHLAAAFALA